MTKKTRNRLIMIFILATPFVLLSVFFFSRLADIPPTPPPLPNPNGYDDLEMTKTEDQIEGQRAMPFDVHLAKQ